MKKIGFVDICYEGGLDEEGRPANTLTEAQYQTLKDLFWRLKKLFPQAFVMGYRDMRSASVKSFPILDTRAIFGLLDKFLKEGGAKMKRAIRPASSTLKLLYALKFIFRNTHDTKHLLYRYAQLSLPLLFLYQQRNSLLLEQLPCRFLFHL